MRSGAKARDVVLAVIALAVVLTGFSLAHSGEADPVSSYHVVEIRQLKFEPAELTVAVGDTVVWINRDIVPHTVSALDAEWSSGELKKDESWQWIARTRGTTRYYCEYHPTMRANLVVDPGSTSTMSSEIVALEGASGPL